MLLSLKKNSISIKFVKLYFYITFFIIFVIPASIHLIFSLHHSKAQQSQPQNIIDSLNNNAGFPLPKNSGYSYLNDYGDPRKSGSKAHPHEGIDIMVPRNTPILAIEDCIIDKIGWDNSGGNRINALSIDGKRRYYYAHLEKFSPEPLSGSYVTAGTIIGFAGSSGYGPPGSDTGTKPHLHIQIWLRDKTKEYPINPYSILKHLEKP